MKLKILNIWSAYKSNYFKRLTINFYQAKKSFK